MGVRKRKSRYGLIASLVATLGLVLAMIGAPASATSPATGELTFEGLAHLPEFPSIEGNEGHFYGQITKAEAAGEDPGGELWEVTATSDPQGDNDLYAQFDYSEGNCEIGDADGSGWFYLEDGTKTGETDNVEGVYDIGDENEDVTSVYGEFDFVWARVGNTATITLQNVNVWLNENVDVNYEAPPEKDDTEGSHDDVLPAPGADDAKAHHVIVDHSGLGEAAFVPLNEDHLAEACPENEPLERDLHAEVVGEAQIQAN